MEMKRTLALTLTVAMVGGLMFMGFAGTAAAQEAGVNDDDGGFDFGIDIGEIDQETGDAEAGTSVSVDQNNNNAQIGESVAVADSTSDDGTASSAADATSTVTQSQEVGQSNTADVDAVSYAESGDNSVDVGGTFDFDLDFDDGDDGDDGDNGDE
ncbi:hypothetical protein [Natronorubrum sp. FCH18a]|uniref:hypothetical protein n=1 Tax=Natronorubrum sp. FCH18a TaxID=3447018 RepID=UPI003F516C56